MLKESWHAEYGLGGIEAIPPKVPSLTCVSICSKKRVAVIG